MNGPTLDHENLVVHSGRSMLARVVAVPPVGKLFTRLASIFPRNEAHVTLDCVDAIHVGFFASVVKAAVPPLVSFLLD